MDTLTIIGMTVLLAAIGAVAGVMAGLLGVGGGIVLVPAFFYAFAAMGYDSAQLMQLCLGTSLATIVVTSSRSVMAHNRKGAVNWAILRGWAPGIAVGAGLAADPGDRGAARPGRLASGCARADGGRRGVDGRCVNRSQPHRPDAARCGPAGPVIHI